MRLVLINDRSAIASERCRQEETMITATLVCKRRSHRLALTVWVVSTSGSNKGFRRLHGKIEFWGYTDTATVISTLLDDKNVLLEHACAARGYRHAAATPSTRSGLIHTSGFAHHTHMSNHTHDYRLNDARLHRAKAIVVDQALGCPIGAGLSQ
eukprot:6212820-Pleurochrysis_carterae.AAC.5